MATYTLTEEQWRRIQQISRWQRNFRVTGASSFTNSPDSCSISIGAPKQAATAQDSRIVLVKVTGAASGGGKYTGRMFIASSGAAATGDLAESDIGADPGGDNCLVLNLEEVGKSTHDLTGGTPVVQFFIGIRLGVNGDGTQVVAIGGVDWEDCT